MLVTVLLAPLVASMAASVAVSARQIGISRWFSPQKVDYGKLPVNFHVLTSPALDFAPWLEIHHVVLLGVPGSTKVFAVDYSPLNQRVDGTVGKLIRGKHVPAEIRVRLIDSTSTMDVADIKRKWTCMGGTGAADVTVSAAECEVNEGSGVVTLAQLAALAEADESLQVVRQIIDRIHRRWSCNMNLYTHNCQHFSHFVRDMLKKEKVCDLEEENVGTVSVSRQQAF